MKIREWKYEYLTASYLLLQHRKASGRSIRLAASHAPRAPLGEMRPRAILNSVGGDGDNHGASFHGRHQRIAFNGNNPNSNFVNENNAFNNNNNNNSGAEKPHHAQPRILTPTVAAIASPRAIARNQVQRHSARPTVTPPVVPPKQTQRTQQQQQQPISSAAPLAPLGSKNHLVSPVPVAAAPKLPSKVAARLPSTSDENDGDKENFIVPQGRASRANRTPQASRYKTICASYSP